jgi:hypothetical protein
MSLTETTVRNAKSREKPYKLSDETGLYVQVNPNGSKLWHLKYRFADKEKRLAFGPQVNADLLAFLGAAPRFEGLRKGSKLRPLPPRRAQIAV